MQEYSRFYCFYLLVLWVFGLTSVFGVRNGQSQQTYVVRYKNGDLTIPVTVVLDDKKQTEYVINMSPRSPEKSVTLYDFKQRTIAYKDLTNRECFLGRLTDETLKHEINALNEIRNPIESNPKILSLDPRKPALTPTEIRNIAGQKTAVFCRKMNTWLIMLQGSHSIRKREADEEVEERTYSHHGSHTIHYSHHERETRSRYRKPRPTSSHMTHKLERSSEDENQNLRPTEQNARLDHAFLFGENSAKQGNNSVINIPAHQASPFVTKTNFRFDLRNSDGINSGHSNNSQSRNVFIPWYQDSSPEVNNELKINNNLNTNYLQNKSSENIEYTRKLNPSHLVSIFNDSSKTVFRNELEEQDRDNPDQHPFLYKNSSIETESHSTDLSSQNLRNKSTPSNNYSDDHTENPEVSIDVLEIPKPSAKFETLSRFQEPHQAFVQPNEDVHTIFEGFHNLRNIFPTIDNKSSQPIIPYDSEIPLNSVEDHTNNLKVFHTLLPPERKNYSLDDTYQEHMLPTTLFTDLPAAKHFPTIQPNFKHRPGIYINKTSLYLHPNVNNDKTENKLSILSQPDSTNSLQNSFHSNTKNQISSFNRSFESTSYNKFLPSTYVPTSTPHESVVSNQLRFQSILRHYKPDEIIIDIEKIPTERPPNSVSRFEENILPSNHFKNRKHFSNMVRAKEIARIGHAPGLRNNRLRNISYPRKSFSNGSKYSQPGITFHPRSSQHRFEEHKKIPLFSSPNKPPSHQFRPNLPSFYNEPPGLLDTLPPGVSLHPRHPQAPYANMLNTNTLQQLPQKHSTMPLKSHRQRHHRKKDHNINRMNGRSPSCCTGLSRRTLRPDVSCCPQLKRSENSKFPHHHSAVLPVTRKFQSQISLKQEVSSSEVSTRGDISPISERKNANDKRSRCQKEKMCRTLYESTRQVMVCRNVDIEGC